MRRKVLYVLGLSTMLACNACSDWLTIQPETSITAETLFKTDEGVIQGINGVYCVARDVYMPTVRLGGGSFVEYMANTYACEEGTDHYLWANHIYGYTDSQEDRNSDLFMSVYNVIANLNPLINEMEKNRDQINPTVYNIVRGEALALRASLHLDLLRIYGPVPSKVDPAKKYVPYVRVNSVKNYEYHTFDRFMDYVQVDLDSAEVLLAKSDPILTTSFQATEYTSYTWPFRKSRLNYYGVLGLQARAALWRGDKEKALRYAKLVKEAKTPDGNLQIRLTTPSDNVADYNVTDLSHYSEHVCGIKCETFDFNDSSWSTRKLALFNLPDFRVVLYGDNYKDDLRYKHFWRTGSGTWYAPDGSILPEYKLLSITIGKFSDFTPINTLCKKNFPIMRLPEIYFIIMECGSLEEANLLYKEYCAARNITYVPLTEEDRQERIILESIREYVGEGQNFYMYKRNNVKRMVGGTTDCSEEQYIVPIPKSEYLDVK